MEWIKNIGNTTEEDLISISNKGIVKRAYKDLEQEYVCLVAERDKEVVLKVGNESCTIKEKLENSSCTCPSRTICRHVVTGILWLIKENPATESDVPEVIEDKGKKDSKAQPDESEKKTKEDEASAAVDKNEKKNEDSVAVEKNEKAEESLKVRIKEIPKKQSEKMADRKSKAGKFSKTEIESVIRQGEEWIRLLLGSGLIRMPEDMSLRAEHIAIMCHNAFLADDERTMRELSNRISLYETHSSESKKEWLFQAIMEQYQKFCRLHCCLESDAEEELEMLAGDFRKSYEEREKLELLPITYREVNSVSGYSGVIYYFLNKNEPKEFFTFSDIRPTFYENKGQKRQRAVTPWGLDRPLKNAFSFEIKLHHPKVSGHKLSISKETTATLMDTFSMEQEAVYKSVYTDFSVLIEEQFEKEEEEEHPVLLCPRRIVSVAFHENAQELEIAMEDRNGRQMSAYFTYKKEEKTFFDQLKNKAEEMQRGEEFQYVIFATFYKSQRRCGFYPIDIFDEVHMPGEYLFGKSEGTIEEVYEDLEPFWSVFSEVNTVLCDIMECGIASYFFTKEIREVADWCEKLGLLHLADLLKELYHGLSMRNHKNEQQNKMETGKIVEYMSEIWKYLTEGRKMILRKTYSNRSGSPCTHCCARTHMKE